MFQALNPGQGVTPGRSGRPTLQLPAFVDVDATTPLYPFRDGGGSEWTSAGISDLSDMYEFGYSYPETPSDLSGDALRTFTIERINALYAPSTNEESFEEDSAGDNVALEEAKGKLKRPIEHISPSIILYPVYIPGSADAIAQNQTHVPNGAAILSTTRRNYPALTVSTSTSTAAAASATALPRKPATRATSSA